MLWSPSRCLKIGKEKEKEDRGDCLDPELNSYLSKSVKHLCVEPSRPSKLSSAWVFSRGTFFGGWGVVAACGACWQQGCERGGWLASGTLLYMAEGFTVHWEKMRRDKEHTHTKTFLATPLHPPPPKNPSASTKPACRPVTSRRRGQRTDVDSDMSHRVCN